MNLRTRFAILTSALVLVVTMAMSLGAYTIASNQLERQVDTSLNQRATRILAIVADSFVKISLTQAVVPFTSPWRSSAVAWGAIAFWLMVTVQFTSLIRNSMPKKYWHGIHMSSYLLAILATLHAVLTGTDVHNRYVTVLIAAGVTIAVASSMQRAFGVGRMRRAERTAQAGRDVAERARVRASQRPPTDAGS